MITDQVIEDLFGDEIHRKKFTNELKAYPLNAGQGPIRELYDLPGELEMTAKLVRHRKSLLFKHTSTVLDFINSKNPVLWNKTEGDIWYDDGKYKLDLKNATSDPNYDRITKSGYPSYCVGSIECSDIVDFSGPNKFFLCVARNGEYLALVASDRLKEDFEKNLIKIREDKVKNKKYILITDLDLSDNTLVRFI